MLRTHLRRNPSDLVEVMRTFDLNGSGLLEYEEVVVLIRTLLPGVAIADLRFILANLCAPRTRKTSDFLAFSLFLCSRRRARTRPSRGDDKRK